jgi:hypothetical protein
MGWSLEVILNDALLQTVLLAVLTHVSDSILCGKDPK